MDWARTLADIDAFLSDEKIRSDIAGFLRAGGYKLEVDEETIVFPKDTHSVVDERVLVRNPSVKGGGYFLVKCVLFSSPQADESRNLGRLKIMYDLEGVYRDDFYSRD
jgi:hypothetical protein